MKTKTYVYTDESDVVTVMFKTNKPDATLNAPEEIMQNLEEVPVEEESGIIVGKTKKMGKHWVEMTEKQEKVYRVKNKQQADPYSAPLEGLISDPKPSKITTKSTGTSEKEERHD